MSDEKLIDVAKAFLGGDQDVVAAGLSQPLGTTGGMAGATDAGFATDSLAGEVAGVRPVSARAARWRTSTGAAMDDARGHPPRPTRSRAAQHRVGWQPESVSATFDGSAIRATVHGRVNVRS